MLLVGLPGAHLGALRGGDAGCLSLSSTRLFAFMGKAVLPNQASDKVSKASGVRAQGMALCWEGCRGVPCGSVMASRNQGAENRPALSACSSSAPASLLPSRKAALSPWGPRAGFLATKATSAPQLRRNATAALPLRRPVCLGVSAKATLPGVLGTRKAGSGRANNPGAFQAPGSDGKPN